MLGVSPSKRLLRTTSAPELDGRATAGANICNRRWKTSGERDVLASASLRGKKSGTVSEEREYCAFWKVSAYCKHGSNLEITPPHQSALSVSLPSSPLLPAAKFSPSHHGLSTSSSSQSLAGTAPSTFSNEMSPMISFASPSHHCVDYRVPELEEDMGCYDMTCASIREGAASPCDYDVSASEQSVCINYLLARTPCLTLVRFLH